MRNPDWVRDEIILALDLYFRAGRRQLPATHPDVIALSETLNELPLHQEKARDERFRNPNGISMILGNFLGIDPEHATPGLSRNNRLQEDVWDDFANDPAFLSRTAESIARVAASDVRDQDSIAAQEVFVEGELLTRLHLLRERNKASVEKKKEQVLKATGRLACEVCEFDFNVAYGRLGEGFAECHHTRPLAELSGIRQTRLADLAVVCANCHRMLHRGRQSVSLDMLQSLVRQRLPIG
ncbi:MAG: HNH endonuclease [Gemmataceae bacterium]|nr:HNH endonuclease [Gemmataceae bacterium]